MRYEQLSVGQLIVGQYPNAAIIMGAGSAITPEVNGVADKNFIGLWLKSTAASGTTRGMYIRTYLDSGAGGETIRAFTTVGNNAPADTCNGAHISLNFGASAGNITGLGTACRNTLHVPNRSLGGTVAAVQAELYSDGASSDIGGTVSFLRCVNDGNATGKGNVDDKTYLMELAGFADGASKVVDSIAGEPTWTSGCILLKVNIGGTVAYLVASKSNS